MLAESVLSFSQHELNRYCYPIDPLPVISGFEDVLNLWDSKREEFRLPSWKSFHEKDLAAFGGRVAVSEKEDKDFRFRVYGNDFVKLKNVDLTNKLLCESVGTKWKGGAYAYFSEISKGLCIGRTQGVVPDAYESLVELSSIDLPLSEDGIVVSHCLHVLSSV